MKITLFTALCLIAALATARADSTIVVAADGSGQFKTVQAAIDSVPADNKQRVVITIKSGDYPDKVLVNRSFVTLRGEDRKKTRLCAAVDSSQKSAKHSWATVEIDGANDVNFENLTVCNPFQTKRYAVALSSINNATRLSFVDCDFASIGGDTVSPWSRGLYYFRNCRFEGRYHFFGPRGTSYVTDCQFWCLGSRISLFNEGIGAETDKLVIRNSTFDGPSAYGLGSYFRDAAWYFIDCTFSDKLSANGQVFRDTKDKAGTGYASKWGENRVYFAGCKGPPHPWLKDNLAESPAKTKDTVTAKWTFGNWDPK